MRLKMHVKRTSAHMHFRCVVLIFLGTLWCEMTLTHRFRARVRLPSRWLWRCSDMVNKPWLLWRSRRSTLSPPCIIGDLRQMLPMLVAAVNGLVVYDCTARYHISAPWRGSMRVHAAQHPLWESGREVAAADVVLWLRVVIRALCGEPYKKQQQQQQVRVPPSSSSLGRAPQLFNMEEFLQRTKSTLVSSFHCWEREVHMYYYTLLWWRIACIVDRQPHPEHFAWLIISAGVGVVNDYTCDVMAVISVILTLSWWPWDHYTAKGKSFKYDVTGKTCAHLLEAWWIK